MTLILGLIAGIFVTMVLIPPLAKMAPILGLEDPPGERKVHKYPIPRVGGISIAIGVLLPVIMWLPLTGEVLGYVIGATWILVFAVVDDIKPLSYKWKFFAQVPAVAIAMHSGIVMEHLPFWGLDPAPPWLAYSITVLFILGITNAINLFDGLDGLAGGCVLLSLGAISYLAFQVDGMVVTLISLALMGGILGFLNFNTHPARVFLGDAGSQFLGFSLAVLAILLIETTHTALNPGLPLLLLGLPILDTLVVIVLRLAQGRSPFSADRQHIHHQLLDSGLSHSMAVSVIYVFQAILVGTAFLMTYQSDLTVVAVFLFECAIFMALVRIALRWPLVELAGIDPVVQARKELASAVEASSPAGPQDSAEDGERERQEGEEPPAVEPPATAQNISHIVEIAVSAFLVLGAAVGSQFQSDISLIAVSVAGLILFAALFLRPSTYLFTRVGVYVASLLVLVALVPLSDRYAGVYWLVHIWLGLLAIATLIGIRAIRGVSFQVTPQDLLVGFFALAVPVLPEEIFAGLPAGFLVISAVILFYACEYLISIAHHRYIVLRIATFTALLIIGLRGGLL